MRTAAHNLAGHALLTVAAAAILGGCLKVRTLIQLRPDGSATLTEKLRFSQRLLDLDSGQEPKRRIARLLTREAVLERMKEMGQGVELVSHQVVDAEQGARESVAVLRVGDISKFRYTSPYPAYLDYPVNNAVRVTLEPIYLGTWWGRRAGDIAVSVRCLSRPKAAPRPTEDEPEPKGPDPLELQILRQLRPVFRDILKDFEVKLTFESYGPLRATGFGHRGRRAGSRRADLIDFSDEDLDKFGGKFLDNEEIMVDLLRGDVGSKNVVEHVEGFANNLTVPVFLAAGSRHARGIRDEIYLPPSRALFDRHFKGKKLTFYYEKGPRKTRPADFREIGYVPRKKKNHADKPDQPGEAEH